MKYETLSGINLTATSVHVKLDLFTR